MDECKSATVHISSAVVSARPERCEEIARLIATLSATEVHFIQNGKIVIVLEGTSVGAVGERLAAIAGMDGVLAANLVFEQVVSLDELGEPA